MTDFWNNPKSPYVGSKQTLVLDEAAIEQIQSQEQSDVFEDEEEDTAELMRDANLRLEQGRLYQMVLQNDIFAETNADPRAVKNVQREIRKFVVERLETMLGIRMEQAVVKNIVSSPFNDLEVTALKMWASRITKGATESVSPPQTETSGPTLPPKKDGITAISGTIKTTPVSVGNGKNKTHTQPKPTQTKSTQLTTEKPKSAIVSPDGSVLTKPIGEMTPQELEEHNKAAEQRSANKKAALPNNLIPHPTPQQLEMQYRMQQSGINLSSLRPYRIE